MRIGTTIIRSRNIPLMFASTVIGGFMFFLPVLALYFEKELFSATNVALIFAVEAFAGVVFEIPSGVIADLFGRKLTHILDFAMMLVSLVFLLIGGSMAMFIAYAVCNAFGRSMSSGADSAMIYDSLQEEGQEKHFKKVIGIFDAMWPLGAALSSIAGGYMASHSLRLPVKATFIPVGIALVISLFLKEPAYEKEGHANILQHAKRSFGIIFGTRQLVMLVTAFFVLWALGETMHLLGPLFLEFKGLPIEWFGWITAGTFGFSSLGSLLSHGVSKRIGNKLTLVLTTMLSPLIILAATCSSGILLAVLWVSTSVLFGIRMPVFNHLLNCEVDSGKRATVISMNNFAGQVGIVAVAPLFGHMAELFSIQTSVRLSAALMLVVPLLFSLLTDKE